VARPHLDARVEEVVRGEVERGAEALDLERARELVAEAVREARRRDDEERDECKRDDASASGTSTAG
jgi:hypothetical protein